MTTEHKEKSFTIDEKEIKAYWKNINHKGLNHKFQCFKKDGKATTQLNVSTAERLIKLCEKHNLQGLSCLSVNPRSKTKNKTSSVTAITNILIDIDVKKDRKKDGVSTPEDKQKAKGTAQAIIKELEEKINLRTSLFIDSGNGYHVYIPVYVPIDTLFTGKNDDGNKQLWDQSEYKGKLARLEEKLNKFNNEICEIDCISKDIVRRIKIPGTWNVKPGIKEKDYRIAKIIAVHGEAIADTYVEGNSKVFDSFKPLIAEDVEQVQETEIPVDETIDLHEILTHDVKAQRLFDGNWKKHYDYKSRSEAELGLAVILLSKGLPEDRIRNALKNAKIGKWKGANKGYRNLTLKRAKIFVAKHPEIGKSNPNSSNNPNNPNNTNNSNIPDKEHLLKHYLSKPKRPYQNIGRGIHNDVCYIATYIEDDDGKSHTAVVTSDRQMYINFKKDKNEIKNDFDLHYREEFSWEIVENTWSNKIIQKWIFEEYTVDLRDIYERIIQAEKKFMVYDDSRIYDCLAIDIFRSYFFFLFGANSRTHLWAEKGSGKTNQCNIFRALMFNPIASPDFSSASIYRTIEATGGTIIVDDFDDLQEDEKQKLNRHIKVNYKPFKTMRSDGGGKFKPQGYDAYSHCVFNNTIGIEDEITKDRVNTFKLLKHKDAPDIEVDYKDNYFSPLMDDLYIALLQFWEQVHETYHKLKIPELKARDLENWKPQLAIAKLIGDDVFDNVFSYAKEDVEQKKIKDLTDDWEYLMYDFILKCFETDDQGRDELEISPNGIALDILDKLYVDLSAKDKDKKVFQLRRFIGGKLSSGLFKKKRPHNRVFYVVSKKNLVKVLESRDLVDVFEERLALLGLLVLLGVNRVREKEDSTLTNSNVLRIDEQPRFDQVQQIKQFFKFVLLNKFDGKNILKDSFSWDEDVDEFIKNELGKDNPEDWIEKLQDKGILKEPVLGELQFLVIPELPDGDN